MSLIVELQMSYLADLDYIFDNSLVAQKFTQGYVRKMLEGVLCE